MWEENESHAFSRIFVMRDENKDRTGVLLSRGSPDMTGRSSSSSTGDSVTTYLFPLLWLLHLLVPSMFACTLCSVYQTI